MNTKEIPVIALTGLTAITFLPPFVLKSAILKKIRHDAVDDANVVKNGRVHTKGTLRDYTQKIIKSRQKRLPSEACESFSRRNRTGSGPVA